MHKRSFLLFILFSGLLIYQNCVPFEGEDGSSVGFSLNGPVTFSQVQRILDAKCVTCHSSPSASNRNVALHNYQAIMDSDSVVAGNADSSSLYIEISTGSMPQGMPSLSLRESEIIRSWIEAGAPSEDGTLANYPPVIQMPADATVQLPINNVEFLAMVVDGDGAILRTVWSQVTGPNTATFTNSRTERLVVSNLRVGNYTFELLAEDDFGAISTGRVNLRVNPAPAPPSPPATTVSFAAQINPILQANCVGCHSGGTPSGNFSMATYAQVITRVAAGNPNGSLLYTRVLNDSMPAGGRTPLTAAQKMMIQTWIQEGATNN